MSKFISVKHLLARSHVIFVFVFCCSLFYASNVTAGAYLGFGLGPASVGLSNYESTSAVRLYAGSRFDNDHGFELEVTQADYSLQGNNVLSTEVRNIVASYALYYSINDRFSVYGKAGINFWKADYKDFGSTLNSKDGTSLAMGVGLNGGITSRLGLRLEYQFFDDIDITEISQLTLTGVFNFR